MKRTPWHDILDTVVDGSGVPPPAIATCRIPRISGWEPGRVWGEWKVDPAMFHGGGSVFGGWLSALADSWVGLAMLSLLNEDEMFTTADLRVSFFRPVSGGTLEGAAEVLHRGRRLAHVEAVFTDDSGKVVAKATATQIIMPLGGERAGESGPGE